MGIWFFVCWCIIGLIALVGYGFALSSQMQQEYGKRRGGEATKDVTHDYLQAVQDATKVRGMEFIAKWFAMTVLAIVSWPVYIPIIWRIQARQIRERAESLPDFAEKIENKEGA